MQTRKGRRTANEERKLMALLSKSYDYLDMNFHKFDEKTRVNIALTLISKRVPLEMNVNGDIKHTHKVEELDVNERINQLHKDRLSSVTN